MKLDIPVKVQPENHRFFVITQWAYIFGISAHLFAGIQFLYLKVHEMVWFNFLFSVPVFIFSFFMNRRGRHNIAFTLAYIELLLHISVGVYYIGWDSGLQYWLIYLVGLAFFNAQWKKIVRILCFTIVFFTYIILYLFFKTPGIYILSKSQYDFFYLGASLSTLLLIALLINYYVQATRKAEISLNATNLELSQKNIQIAQALSERKRAMDLLNDELNEAAEYVRSILPEPISERNLRTDWRFIPSTSLGGDAFGYHWLDEDHFIIYLIDVSGHGVGPALLSISAINAIRSQSLLDTDFKDPASVLQSLNVAFPGEENHDLFFTIWYGVFDRNTHELTYACGGHPPALLLNKTTEDDVQVDKLRTSNYVIGGMPDLVYKKAKHQIDPGSVLYIYSDGVYEHRKEDGSMWPLKDFAEFMSQPITDGRSKLDLLYDNAMRIGKSGKLEDDFTIVEIVFS